MKGGEPLGLGLARAGYAGLGAALWPLTLVIAGGGAVLSRRWRPGLSQRLGVIPEEVEEVRRRPVRLWVHAASIGEVRAAHPLLAAISRERPEAGIYLTTTTPEGQRTARSIAPTAVCAMAPLDHLPGLAGRVLDAVLPDALVVLETELWPGLLHAARSRLVPALLVNGRLSERAFRRYRLVRPLAAGMLREVSAFGMQAEADRERILALGADPARVEVAGNLKYDALSLPPPAAPSALLPIAGERVLVAGSTREGEEGAVAEAYLALQPSLPGLRLVVAPRHLARVEEARRILEAKGLPVVRRSELVPERPPPPGAVVLLDTTGELSGVYGLASAVFVGGSLVPVGGHNPLEPLAQGRPVAFGPFTENFAEVARAVIEVGGGKRVADGASLAEALRPWLADPARARAAAEGAKATLIATRGAVARTLALLARFLGPPGTAPSAEGARPALDGALGAGLSTAYRAAITARRSLYDHGALPVSRVTVPVISVGGLTAGGSGKTPATILAAERLIALGRRVAVVSRGYGGRPGPSPRLVAGGWDDHAGETPPVEQVGDEPLVIARRVPQAAVVVHPDRVLAARFAVERGAEVVLLDDGFQHRRLARDLDLVCLDALRPFDGGRFLPAGYLRDLPLRLSQAGLVLLTRAGRAGPGATARAVARIGLISPAPVARFEHRVTGLRGPSGLVPLEGASSLRPLLVSGIAEPASFRQSLPGLTPAGELSFPDHHAFDEADRKAIEARAAAAGARAILTTAKDAVRLPPLSLPVFVAELTLVPLEQRELALLDAALRSAAG